MPATRSKSQASDVYYGETKLGIKRIMRRFIPAILLSLLLLTTADEQASADESTPINVFILAGQSNMAGADSVVAEPPGFRQTPADRATQFTTAPIPDGAKSMLFVPWGEIQGHSSKEKLVHGPEVGLARVLHESGWRNVAIIKVFANFGRDAQVWPWGEGEGGYLFKAWTRFVDERLGELRKQGHSVHVRGFVWNQGIDDAIHRQFATQYERNLTNLIGKLRERYDADRAPFVLARSVNSRIAQPGPDPDKKSPMAAVRRAQMQTAAAVPNVAWINVDDLPNVNTHHFTAQGQLAIGRRFGEAFLRLEKDPGVPPIAVAHRGLLRHAPENTLPAFAACLELGIGFELDVRTAKDGQLVVLHDDNIQRTTDGPSQSVRDLTLRELKQLDAGSWFDKAYAGVRVPTLEETLSLISRRKRGPTIIALNVKDVTRDAEASFVALVEKCDLLSESFAFDQSDEMSRRLKERNAAFRIGQNVNRQSIDARLAEGLLDCFLLTSLPAADEVLKLRRQSKQALFNFAGTGEGRRNPAAWQQAAEAGIDGLLTDYPLECRSTWRTMADSSARTPPLDPRGVWVETPWATPVIDRGVGGAWDHMAVDNPYIHVEGDTLFCFYEAQDKPIAAGGREAFGIAISHNGTTWKKLPRNPILTTGDGDAWDHIVAKLPVGVIKRDGLYHLFYSGRDKQTKQIGLATASELVGPWTKSPDNPVLKSRTGKWDKFLSTHPAPIFEMDGRYHLLFRGMERRYQQQGVGLADSSDLRHWRRSADMPLIPVGEEIASLAVARGNQTFVAISQPLDLRNRTYWFSDDLKQWRKGSPVNFRASIQAETLSNPFLFGGRWTVLYEQQDRIYRAVLQPPASSDGER
jgi:glycerophosphoryl diester phosphodiesterase